MAITPILAVLMLKAGFAAAGGQRETVTTLPVTQIVSRTLQHACLADGDSLAIVNQANAVGWPQFHEQRPPASGFEHYAASEIAGKNGGHLGLLVAEMTSTEPHPRVRWTQCNAILDRGAKDQFSPLVAGIMGEPTSRGIGPDGPEVRWAFIMRSGTKSQVHDIPFDSPEGLIAFMRCCATADRLTVVKTGTSQGMPYIAVDNFEKLDAVAKP